MAQNRLKNILCNSGYEEAVFTTFRQEIAKQNLRMVQTTSFIGSIMMVVLSISALFVSSVSRVLPLYLTTAVVFIGIYAVSKLLSVEKSRALILCNYAFLVAAFFFALGLDAIQKNTTATTVCVLLVALPLLIVDKTYREFLFFLFVSVCFMFESMYIKQSPKASIDVLNAISFLCVGTFLGYKHNQMVLRNFFGQYQLKRERDTDALTNLYNKSAFESLAREYVQQNLGTAGMIIIDMDNFKYINDHYGHQAGDEILAKVGKLLSSQFRSGDYVCRFGGDEFVAFLPHSGEHEVLQKKAQEILDGVAELRIDADEDYRAHLCMGIAAYPADADTFETLFRNADDAMYRVKRNGKNGFAFYDVNFRKKILLVDDIEMNRAILKKILGGEYDLLEATNGVEALQVLADNTDIAMVLTDIQMPCMDGVNLIKAIRADEKYYDLAIVANTQYGDAEQDEQIIGLGADDFIYKAATPAVIQKRVKNVLQAREML